MGAAAFFLAGALAFLVVAAFFGFDAVAFLAVLGLVAFLAAGFLAVEAFFLVAVCECSIEKVSVKTMRSFVVHVGAQKSLTFLVAVCASNT